MFRRTRGPTKPSCAWSVYFAVSPRPDSFIQLVESAQPDIAHGDFARLAFDLEADESRLVIDGVLIVIDEDRHQLAVHDVHHHTAARDDLVIVPFVDLHIATECLLVADIGNHAGRLAGQRLRYLAALGEDSLH